MNAISISFFIFSISISFFIFSFFSLPWTYGEAHKITSLPDQPPVNFSQHSGYITVDVKHQRNLFFYFVEAEIDPTSKPVILWLHGGPGCSGVGEAAFSQHGPFLSSSKGLVKNPYSWNRVANMLYLDSPAGVGFSYSKNTSDYVFLNDEFAARDHLAFLQIWFIKFPKFRTNDFFIAGESYAGHFGPQLANLILQTKSKIPLKGLAMGNPLLEFEEDFNSMNKFLWYHGVISESTYEMLNHECSVATMKKQKRATGKLSARCFKVNTQLQKELNGDTDQFDILAELCPVAHTAAKLSVNINTCVHDDSNIYLNRKDVQQALDAKLVGVNLWSTCSSVLVYDFQNLENPSISLLGPLIKEGIRVLTYSGDQDSVIPFISTRSLINGLARDLGLDITRPHQAWYRGDQIGGWTQTYGYNLTFATVKGAGHSTPISRPESSLDMLKAFLEGKPLPIRPPLIINEH